MARSLDRLLHHIPILRRSVATDNIGIDSAGLSRCNDACREKSVGELHVEKSLE